MKTFRYLLPILAVVALAALIGPDRFDWRYVLFGFLAPLVLFGLALALHALSRRLARSRRGVL
ncbi:hypothetical protein [Phenylobacterium sp.]|uniref:hypothetical protein n=1 Tax=Phenylobacterium sp. TaxID=1871053 RepID=UPI002731E369|nr:hypothetical protein [Phenylobacterium sp.]